MTTFTHLIELYKTKKTSALRTVHPDFYDWLLSITPFLPEVSTTRRLWHVWNNTYSVPKCQCGVDVNWDIVKQTYRAYCSRSCTGIYLKRPKIHIDIIQCANAGCTNTVKFSDGNWKKCCSKVCSLSYRSDLRATPEEVQECISSLPIDYPYIKFVTAYRSVHNSIYDTTSHLPVSYQIQDRIKWMQGDLKTKREKMISAISSFGVVDSSVSTILHARAITNTTIIKCLLCSNNRIYTGAGRFSKFCGSECKTIYHAQVKQARADKAIAIALNKLAGPQNRNTNVFLNNSDWLRTKHLDEKWTKQQLAIFLSVDKETITNRFKSFNIKSVRHPGNAVERQIVQLLGQYYTGSIVTNSRSIIAPKELDVYLPELKLAIEYCGLYWHSDVHERITNKYHADKLKACNDLGIRLITIFEDEWLHKRTIVENKLLEVIGQSTAMTVYARKTTCVILTNTERKQFLLDYHIQGDKYGAVAIGLKFEGKIVATMVLSDNASMWYIERYATACNVPGGFSKLLKWFERQYVPTEVVTFADLRWSEGKLYSNNGFTLSGILPPDYSYIDSSTIKRKHKSGFRHSSLASKLVNYDPLKSEYENTKAAGIGRIWDCGKLRYTKLY